MNDILREIRATRDEMARRHGYDLASLVRELQEKEAASGREVVTRPPRRPAGYVPPRPASSVPAEGAA